MDRFPAAVLAAALTGALLAVPSPASAEVSCAQPGSTSTAVPWPQSELGFDRAWATATGDGVTVAVLDSGVDAGHPQLRGHIATGADFLHRGGGPPGDSDCVGHGTAVASLIAAQAQDESGLRGVAPGARILPVTVSEKSAASSDESGDAATPAQFGAAVRWAVQEGAEVINLSVVYYTDYPEIRSAIEDAIADNVVVVAAVGNLGDANDGNPTPYPAAYPDVIGVGAVDRTGVVARYSAHGSYVDVVAPGEAVVAATPGGGSAEYGGTSLAAAFVSGAAALVRQYWPELTVAQLAERLRATADPAAGGADASYYGHGLIDPYRAVTQRLGSVPALDQPAAPVQPDDAEATAAAARERRVRAQSLVIATLGAVVAVLAVVAIAARRRGRRTKWRPTRADPPPAWPDDRNLAPVGLFDHEAT